MASELLLIALLAKFMLENAPNLPQGVFMYASAALAFFVGAGDRLGAQVFRQGLSIAILVIFYDQLAPRSLTPVYWAFLGALILSYILGRFVRHTWWLLLGLVVLLTGMWIALRR